MSDEPIGHLLPLWCWDLLADLVDQEHTHPKLYRQTTGNQYVEHDWCPQVALDRLPPAVRSAAEVIARYRKTDPEGNPA